MAAAPITSPYPGPARELLAAWHRRVPSSAGSSLFSRACGAPVAVMELQGVDRMCRGDWTCSSILVASQGKGRRPDVWAKVSPSEPARC